MNPNTEGILERIRSLPSHELTIPMRSPRGTFERSFKGASFYDYAAHHALTPNPMPVLGPANFYYVATAEDGFKVVLAFAEVAPTWSKKQVLLAYEQDGEPIRAGVRLVVPNDDLAGRAIGGVSQIELKSALSQSTLERPQSSSVELMGLLDRPQHLDAAFLSQFETREVETPPTDGHGGPRRYRGAPLFAILEGAGMKLDDSINEDVLLKVIIARSTDGYAAAISTGEIEPRFMAGDVIVATSCDGHALTDDGLFRLVVPHDRVIGRCVKSLASLELVQG